MGLVDYSDSETSGVEDIAVSKPTSKPSKGNFQKVVDRSNPGKIKVSLPEPAGKGTTNGDEPPAKRIKTGSGGLSSFNSLLPAPKGRNLTLNTALGGGSVLGKSGLAPGVSLKTGAAPGFTREVEPGFKTVDEEYSGFDGEDQAKQAPQMLNLTPPKTAPEPPSWKPAQEVKLVGKPLMFKPLSVARNPAKKKNKQSNSNTFASTGTEAKSTSSTTKVDPTPQKPKISLFSISEEPRDPIIPETTGDYQPLIYRDRIEDDSEPPPAPADSTYSEYTDPSQPPPAPANTHQGAQSLYDIASDLNLSSAARRQLFGRQKGSSFRNSAGPSITKVINFNTDEEYRVNEELRAKGEQVVYNPVKAIAPGKHSLKQLISAAENQKEALEESFAKGKGNRKEAGSRYGW